MTTEMPPSNGDRPTSWRDVYTLVQDVEKRLTDRIDEAVASTRQVTTDHENRIRTVETIGAPNAQAASALAAANALRITALEAANVVRQAQRQGQTQFITYGQKVIMAVIVLVNVAIALIALFRP